MLPDDYLSEFAGISNIFYEESDLTAEEIKLLDWLLSLDFTNNFDEISREWKLGYIGMETNKYNLDIHSINSQNVNIALFAQYSRLVRIKFNAEFDYLRKITEENLKGVGSYHGGVATLASILSRKCLNLVYAGVHYLHANDISAFNQCLILLQSLYLICMKDWHTRDDALSIRGKGGKAKSAIGNERINQYAQEAYEKGLRTNIEIGKYIMLQEFNKHRFESGYEAYKEHSRFETYWKKTNQSQNTRYKRTILPKIKSFLESLKSI